MQPHRNLTCLNANPDDPIAFQEQVKVVCDLYQAASSLYEQGIHLISTDEMTAIQALFTCSSHSSDATRSRRISRV